MAARTCLPQIPRPRIDQARKMQERDGIRATHAYSRRHTACAESHNGFFSHVEINKQLCTAGVAKRELVIRGVRLIPTTQGTHAERDAGPAKARMEPES